MIETYLLSELLKQYGIDANKVIKNNDRILDKGEYFEIKYSLDYLINELHILPKNIEKCPSIMYLNVSAIKSNYEFLINNHLYINNIETCLHVLSTEPNQLKNTYNYVLNNYGIEYINKITSILSVEVSRIKSIKKFNLSPYLTLSISISQRTVDEIEKIIQVCKDNKINLSGTIFERTADEIEKILKVCRENNIEPSGTIFLRTADEIEKILKVCRENNIEPSGTIFQRTADEIERIIKVCRENKLEPSGTIFTKTAEEIERIIKVCRENKIEPSGTIFLKTADEIKNIIKICNDNNIKITGILFIKKPKSLIQTINFIKENYGAQYLTSLIIVKNVEYIKKVFPYLAEIGVLEYVIKSASILSLTLDEIVERKQFIESIGVQIVLDNGKFNSIFGMSRKNYQKRVESIKEDLSNSFGIKP